MKLRIDHDNYDKFLAEAEKFRVDLFLKCCSSLLIKKLVIVVSQQY